MTSVASRKPIAFDPLTFLERVGQGKSITAYNTGDVIYAQGDKANTIFYLQTGRAKLVVHSEQGKEAVVGMIMKGQFFGEGCLNGHPYRIATTTAMEASVITSITKKAMRATIQSEPKFSEMFMAYLLSRNGRIEEDLIDHLFNSHEKRLARLLLLMANFGKDGKSQLITPAISQATLAEMIGSSVRYVNGFMNKFRKLGLIDYNRTVIGTAVSIKVHTALLDAVLHEKSSILDNEETE